MSPSVYSCFGLVLRVPPLVVLPRRTCRRLRTAHSTHAQHKTSSNGYTMAALHLQLTSVQLGCLRYSAVAKANRLTIAAPPWPWHAWSHTSLSICRFGAASNQRVGGMARSLRHTIVELLSDYRSNI